MQGHSNGLMIMCLLSMPLLSFWSGLKKRICSITLFSYDAPAIITDGVGIPKLVNQLFSHAAQAYGQGLSMPYRNGARNMQGFFHAYESPPRSRTYCPELRLNVSMRFKLRMERFTNTPASLAFPQSLPMLLPHVAGYNGAPVQFRK
jgi:hypothetical protein